MRIESREAARPRSWEVKEVHVEGAPFQRFGRVGEGVRESESELEFGMMRSALGASMERVGDGEGEDIVWPWPWLGGEGVVDFLK